MVVFSLTAQVLDMFLIKTTAFTIDTTLSVVGWGGKKLINMLFYSNSTIPVNTTEDKLKHQISVLSDEIKLLKAESEPYMLVEIDK